MDVAVAVVLVVLLIAVGVGAARIDFGAVAPGWTRERVERQALRGVLDLVGEDGERPGVLLVHLPEHAWAVYRDDIPSLAAWVYAQLGTVGLSTLPDVWAVPSSERWIRVERIPESSTETVPVRGTLGSPVHDEPPTPPYLSIGPDEVVVELAVRKPLVVGTDSAADVVIESDPTVSRYHAVFEANDPQSVNVSDLGSTNGTIVNGVATDSITLADGDVVVIGATQIVVTAEQGSVVRGGPADEDPPAEPDSSTGRP